MRGLVVDDSALMRSIVRKALIVSGVECIDEVTNGIEALDTFERGKYDIIITDIIMNNMDGITLLKRVKELDKNQKIVICSSMGQSGCIAEAVQNGVSDFVIKPFKVDNLIKRIRQLLK